jgi:hypothetical protein
MSLLPVDNSLAHLLFLFEAHRASLRTALRKFFSAHNTPAAGIWFHFFEKEACFRDPAPSLTESNLFYPQKTPAPFQWSRRSILFISGNRPEDLRGAQPW